MKHFTFWKSTLLLLFALVVGSVNGWGQTYNTVLTLDCATPAATGSTSTQLTQTTLATFLNSAAGLSSAQNKITCSAKSGDVYTGKGSGGGNIPQQCLKIGKSSGGGSFTFTIPDTYDAIDRVELTCYGWKTASSISINSGTAQTFTTALSETTKTFDLASSTRTISIAVTTSAVCVTSIVLKSKQNNVTSLTVKNTSTNKINYKVAETLNLTGLKLDADGTEVTSGYTAKIGETTVTSGTTVLNTVGAQTITFTYGGKTCTQVIHVGALQGLTLTTTNVKTTYFHNEEAFNPENLVVTASFSDEEETATTWGVELTSSEYSYTPTTTLLSSNDKVTVSYTWNNVEKTADIPLTVYAVSSLAVTTAPTTTAYRVGDNLDLTGVVITATFNDPSTTQKEIASSNYTALPADGTALTAENTAVTFSYAGQSVNQAISVGTLDHLTYNATGEGAFANTSYTEQDKFNAEGLVVNAHFTNGIVNENVSGYSLSPDTDTELTTDNDKVTVSYSWQGTTQTVEIPIEVSDGPQYTVTFSAQGGSCETESLTESDYKAGVTLPTATIDVAGWTFAGWKETSAAANTTTRPTLFAAGSTYKPQENCTLYAVYKLAGIDDTKFKRATSVEEITSAGSIVIVNNKDNYVLNHSRQTQQTAPSETNGMITPDANMVFAFSGNNTNGFTITGENGTLGVETLPTSSGSKATSWRTDNNKWIVGESEYANKTFYFRNAASTYACLEYSYGWVAYYVKSYSNNQYTALKVYVPVQTAYNSNPAAIITPTVEFDKEGTTLYLDGTNTYTNTATSDPTKAITYSSSNEDVATVDENGVVTAVGIGTATITASVEKELGVSNAAQDTYEVTVKSTTTIAGIKGVNSTTTAKAFTADLTDANITYVSGTHAYIQDASAAIYVSCAGEGWIAGKKFTGAVSGKVKKSYGVWEITELTGTPVDGGTVPAALTDVAITDITSETYASYEGKKITLTGVTVSTAMTSTATSGGEVSDGTNTIKIGAPAQGITLVKDEQGSVTGFVSQYNSTYRLNLYEQSQFAKTHNAPTAQDLSFEEDAIELDEDTEAFSNFIPQTVGGAQGTVTYAIANTSGDVIYDDFNTADGTFTLKAGAYGTATITATAAAANITEGGVTTPYTETTKSYTVTVNPRYTSTFSINGVVSEVRQATYGASIEVPTPGNVGDYYFMGWKASSAIDTPTDEAPEMVTPPTTPTSNVTYYAVFALQTVGEDENVELYKNIGSTGTDATSGITAAGNINKTSSNGNPGNSFGLTSDTNKTATFTNINLSSVKSASLTFDYKLAKSGNYYSSLTVTQYDKDNAVLGSAPNITGSDQNYHTTSAISLDKACVKITIVCSPANTSTYNTFVDNVTINVVQPGVGYEGYCTSFEIPTVSVSVSSAGYATFSSTQALDFTDEASVYAYTATVDGENITFTRVNKVPANTGLLLRRVADEGIVNVNVPVFDGTSADNVTGNLFVAATTEIASLASEANNCTNYILNNGSEGIGFYLANDRKVGAGKAYLAVPNNAGIRGFIGFDFSNPTTGITIVKDEVQQTTGAAYDLQGRRVSEPKNGLYIINGKKVLLH